MYTGVKRNALVAALSVIGCGILLSAAQAQAPFFRVQPSATGAQAQGMGMGMGMGMGFNPYGGGMGLGAGGGFSPFLNNGLGVGSMSSAAGGFSPFSSFSPYGGGFSGLGFNGFFPGFYQDPANGYLTGAASVIQSQSQYIVSWQQGKLMKEQVRREQIENRRRALDEWLYERDKRPTAEDERERVQKQVLRRARNDPPPTEIYSATALNTLLDHLKKQQPSASIQAAQFPLDEDTLLKINVAPPNTPGNFGLLKNEGNLNWPLGLQTADFKQDRDTINALLPDAVRQAARESKVGANTLTDLNASVQRVAGRLEGMVRDIPIGQYREAKRFVESLKDAVKVLGSADVGNYLNRVYVAKGQSVPDLLNYMKGKGLKFAPAVAGDEAAYMALYQALAAYDTATQSQVAEQRAPAP